jgi:hypothetical protein
MPKEIIRKRGKRKPKTDASAEEKIEEAYQAAQNQASTSTSAASGGVHPDRAHLQADPDHEGGGGRGGEADWVTPGDGGYGSIRERVDGDAPWGFVETEVSKSPSSPTASTDKTASS